MGDFVGPPPPYTLTNGLSKPSPFFGAIVEVVTEIEWMGGRGGGGEELVPFCRPHLVALHFSDIGGISWDRHLLMLSMAFPKPFTPVHVFLIAILEVVREIEWLGGSGGREELVPFFNPLGSLFS